MNARDLIESLNNLDEHERIEAKRAEQVGPTVMESVFAFANEPNLSGRGLLLGGSARKWRSSLRTLLAVSTTHPMFSTRDFKAVPKRYRTLIPEYVKDYVSLNQFTA